MRNGPVTVYDKDGNLIRGQIDIPPQYLKGWVEFYKLKFKVTPDVLIPRPETELLVDEVINSSSLLVHGSSTILDVGTGSGCIAISIAKNAPKVKIFATDISGEALEVARQNAKKHRVDKKIFFLKSDLLDKINFQLSTFNSQFIIVTNLPYIPNHRIDFLDPSVRDFEPRIALQGGLDGFDLYRRLFSQMKEKNLIPKLFIGEIDESQAKIALSEAKKYFPKAKVEVKKDLAKKPRILIIKF
jgi:release factor glutamine methyltransferase